MKKRLSTEVVQEAVVLYQGGLSLKQVGERFGRTPSGMLKIFREVGMKTRSSCEGVRLRRFRHHKVDEEAFDNPGREGKYWLGFLMADGSINTDRVFTLTLKSADQAHLEKFRSFLRSEHPLFSVVRRYSSDSSGDLRHHSGLAIGSRRLVTALAKFGVTTTRTHTAMASPELCQDRDFWRGVVDGDGYILRRKTGLDKGRPILGICGSHALMSQFLVFVRTIASTRAEVRPHGKISAVNISGPVAVKVAEVLYKDAPIYLDRKYEMAMQISS